MTTQPMTVFKRILNWLSPVQILERRQGRTALVAAPEGLFSRSENIVFEHHHIDGHEEKLRVTLARLQSAGYQVRRQGQLVWATRAQGGQEP